METREKNKQQALLESTSNSPILKQLLKFSSFVQLLRFLICEMQPWCHTQHCRGGRGTWKSALFISPRPVQEDRHTPRN